MPVFPWRAFACASLATSCLVLSPRPGWTTTQLTGLFAGLFLLQSLAWGLWAAQLYPKLLSPLRHLPEPAGNTFWMGQFAKIRDEPTGIPMRDWVASVPNEGLIRYKGFCNQERLLVTSPKALSEVLVTRNYDFEKPRQVRQALARLLGVGVLVAEGDQHKIQRRMLMPAFAFRHVKDLYSVFWRKGREAVQAMTKDVNEKALKPDFATDPEKAHPSTCKGSVVIEVGSWASRATLDIIGLAGLGRDFGAIEDPNNRLSRTYQAVFAPNKQARMLTLLALVLPNWVITRLPIKRNDDIIAAAATIRSVCADVIREKKDKMRRKEPTEVDITSVALESGAFTDEDLVNQLMTFLAAGHETTASSMVWAVYMLCRNRDIQTRLRQEIREKLPSADSDYEVSSLDIDHMPYLNAVCNEVLRYYSPVPLTVRDAAVDTSILGHAVPKGTRIILCPWATNFDKSLWGPDAGEFKPERWIAKDDGDKKAASGGASSNYAFMSFLHGPRSCIGQAFAKAEFACLLATWVGRFEFELANKAQEDEKNLVIKGGVTAKPAHGLYVRATVLGGW